MEKFFRVKENSNFYNLYFDYIFMSDKVNEIFKQFAMNNGIESTRYYQNTSRLCVVLTENDKKKFGDMLVANSTTNFKKTSSLCKKWVELCKKHGLESPRKPSVMWDSDSKLNSCHQSQRLFHIGEKLYGSVDNNSDSEIVLSDCFVEMKASEFYKIIEDYESEAKDNE